MASVLLFAAAGPVRADEVKLTTALEVGKQISLSVNPGLKLTLTWGDGQTETLTASGTLQNLTVKHTDLTISTTEGSLTALYLQGNALTNLDVTKAPELKFLLAADNQLAKMDLAKCTKLQSVDLQGNRLTSFAGSTLTELTDLNVAANELGSSGLRMANTARPHYLVAQHNKLSSTISSSLLSEVRTLWISDNQYRNLTLSGNAMLRSLCAANNQIKTLTLANMPLLEDVWVEHNQLAKLDLSKGSPKLQTLSADHNKLTEVLWDVKCKNPCRFVYLNDNALFLNSMPALKISGQAVKVNYQPQTDFDFGERYELNKEVDLAPYINKNGWGLSTFAKYTLTNAEGQELVKGTDYTESSRKITFLTSHKGVVLKVQDNSGNYQFRTAPFTVGSPTGIEQAPTTQTEGFSVYGERGALRIETERAAAVSVYNAAGASVYRGTIEAGTHRLNLPAGIYVVNGSKVVVA